MRWLAWALLLGACARKLEFEESPFDQVLSLLGGMKKDLEKEGKEDEAGYEEMISWCKAAKANQTRIISESSSLIETQSLVVKESRLMAERLALDLRNLDKEIASSQATLAKAQVLREDQRQKFAKDTASLREDINAVTQALGVVGPSLLQSPALSRLQQVVDRNYDRIKAKASKAELMFLNDFLKDPSQFTRGLGFLQRGEAGAPTTSDTVVGMLQAMADDFKADLQEEEDEDAKLESSYQALVNAKKKEVVAGKEQVAMKEQQKADSKQKVVTGKEDISTATSAKAEAEAFLSSASAKCATEAESFQQRHAARQEELTAVTQATEVLTGEEAQTLKKPSFLQLSSKTVPAAEVLANAGRSLGKQELVQLSVEAMAGSFDKVKEAIEGMLRALKQEQKEEVHKNDECKKDFAANLALTEENQEQLQQAAGKLREWKADVTAVKGDISKFQQEVEDLKQQLQAARDTRAKETSQFAEMIADERTTQRLLSQAQEVLTKVYGTSLMQERSQRVSGSAVMEMLEVVRQKSQDLEAKTQEADEASRKSFEKLSEKIQEEIDSTTKDLGKKSIVKSDLESDMTEAKRIMGLTEEELTSLAETKRALHASCDEVMKNFEATQKGRSDEIQALEAARSILP